MTHRLLLAVLRELRPREHAASPNYARRVRIEWRILRALERAGHIRPLSGRAWTREQLLAEAFASEEPPRPRHGHLVLVVDRGARGDADTAV
ncbi:MAG: hypothetical protein KF764_10575 [Labilithrix sp.]|nr:hypothetical protein [Labilithrix sp.]